MNPTTGSTSQLPGYGSAVTMRTRDTWSDEEPPMGGGSVTLVVAGYGELARCRVLARSVGCPVDAAGGAALSYAVTSTRGRSGR